MATNIYEPGMMLKYQNCNLYKTNFNRQVDNLLKEKKNNGL